MTRNLTCIICPNGCELAVETDAAGGVLAVTGHICPRGEAYARQEVTAPMRNLATSVAVQGGVLPLCSVRLTAPIPKQRIFEVTAAIHALRLTAPVAAGQVLLPDVLGLGADVIATRSVEKA